MGEARRRKQLLQDPNYKISIIAKQLAASLNRSPVLKIVILAFLSEALVYELEPNLVSEILFEKVTEWLDKNSNIVELAELRSGCFIPTDELVDKLLDILIIMSMGSPKASSEIDFSRFNPYNPQDVYEALTIILKGIYIGKQFNLI